MASVTFVFCTVLMKLLPAIDKGFNLPLCLTLKIKLKTIKSFHKTTNANSKEFDNFEMWTLYLIPLSTLIPMKKEKKAAYRSSRYILCVQLIQLLDLISSLSNY